MTEPGTDHLDEDFAAETSVDIAADVDRVWNALITDGGLEPWMGVGASIDPSPGGRLILPDVVGGRPRAGRVDQIDEQNNLAFTWWPMTRPSDQSTVSISVTQIETGTRVTVREAPILSSRVSATVDSAVDSAVGFAADSVSSVTQVDRLIGTRSFTGFWAWRLAVLTMSCQAVRV